MCSIYYVCYMNRPITAFCLTSSIVCRKGFVGTQGPLGPPGPPGLPVSYTSHRSVVCFLQCVTSRLLLIC